MVMLMMMIKQRLQGFSHLSSSGHIGDWEESSGGIAVRIVGASCCGQTGGQLEEKKAIMRMIKMMRIMMIMKMMRVTMRVGRYEPN